MRPLTNIVYLTIRLQARDFYEMIVDEGEARINYNLKKLRASNLIVLVESVTKHKILRQKTQPGSHFFKKMRQENVFFATGYLSRNRCE